VTTATQQAVGELIEDIEFLRAVAYRHATPAQFANRTAAFRSPASAAPRNRVASKIS
jgi:hypothetical protein